MADVKAIPEGYPQVSPYLHVRGAGEAIEFYRRVFGAAERLRMPGPGGTIGHAELALGDSLLMLSDEYPDMGVRGPRTVGGTPVTLMVYVEDVDAVVERAVEAGATVVRPLQDAFYGDRTALLEDPFGHQWSVATHIQDVPADEMARRAAEAAGA